MQLCNFLTRLFGRRRPVPIVAIVAQLHGSTCQLEHRCAVCGGPALDPGHSTRGYTWKRDGLSNCPPQFLVRCGVCSCHNRKLPGQLLAIEMGPVLFEGPDSPAIVYELM